ncbi:transposase [Alcanivorax sp. S6407]|uniref:transposase n=1 Tax=Alcanivorax sp. S6407 TaxID=2926424 RepID=UPI001FF29370|nr:transposase [Alcanivorax sp. S6407]MCK0153119.1 transposase [Alcanivorax sp. S6407]
MAEVFAIDLCAYAVMSNHYHLVVSINQQKALSWSDREVAERWMQLFSGPLIVKRWLKGESGEAESLKAEEIVSKWRERLYDLGWFMKCLNEHLARRANEEDCCKGRFWESRYKCQALLDEQAVLQCMAYVDLNPVRADMAATPEESDYTSIQQRALKAQGKTVLAKEPRLLALVDAEIINSEDQDTIFRFRLMDYLELVDSTGRAVRDDKRGAISEQAAGVLDRLGIDERTWLAHMRPKQRRQPVALGALYKLKEYAEVTGRKWISGQSLVGW